MSADRTTIRQREKPSVICEQCNMRPVMDRCRICEDCWYSTQSRMRDKPIWTVEDDYNAHIAEQMMWGSDD
jgi:hypothetical protein